MDLLAHRRYTFEHLSDARHVIIEGPIVDEYVIHLALDIRVIGKGVVHYFHETRPCVL